MTGRGMDSQIMITEQRIVLVEPNSQMRPTNVGWLCELQYLERSILQMSRRGDQSVWQQ